MNIPKNTTKRYPKELKERAVRLVLDHLDDYPSEWQATKSISEKFGIAQETLRRWVRQTQRDEGTRPGPSTAELERIKELERENRELRRANEILKSAAAFFGAELDRPHRR